jgi:hypothetical protein
MSIVAILSLYSDVLYSIFSRLRVLLYCVSIVSVQVEASIFLVVSFQLCFLSFLFLFFSVVFLAFRDREASLLLIL